MEESDRACLRSNNVKVIEDLIVDDKLLAILFQEKILSKAMKEEIEVEKTSHGKASKLVSILPRRGQRAFRCFVEALVDTDQDDLAFSLDTAIAHARKAMRDNPVSPTLASRPAGISTRPSPTGVKHSQPQKSLASPTTDVQTLTNYSLMNIEIRTIDDVDAQNVLNEPNVYPVNGAKRGRALIINNEHFYEFPEREGSNFDLINLDVLFTKLQFTTLLHRDKSAAEIIEVLTEESKHEDHHAADMFVLVIMSHGEGGVVCGVDGKEVSINDTIIAAFDGNACPALRGKPKLFIIQACQGDTATRGVLQADGPADINQLTIRDKSDAIPSIDLHERSDIVAAYSTVTGYKSWRHTAYGSWFVRAIVDVFAKNACRDRLLDLLQQVRNQVAAKCTSVERYKQMTETRESLTKKVYLLPGYSPT